MNKWHFFKPGENFTACNLYESICNALLDENRLEIEQRSEPDGGVYYWRLINNCNKIILHGTPGQALNITLSEVRQE